MPFQSEAQRRKFYAMEEDGEIAKGTTARWEKETGGKQLPERKKSAFVDAVMRTVEREKSAKFDPRKVESNRQVIEKLLARARGATERRVQKGLGELSLDPQRAQRLGRNWGMTQKELAEVGAGARVGGGPPPQPKLSSLQRAINSKMAASNETKLKQQVEEEITAQKIDCLNEQKTAVDALARRRQEEKEEAEGNPVTMDEVRGFLRKNQNPEDYELHSWAEGKGVSPHSAEELIYQLAAQQVTGKEPVELVEGGEEEKVSFWQKRAVDLLAGGKAEGKPSSNYPKEQVQQGIRIEKEHTPSSAIAEEIARDHLEEFPNYYSALQKMEKKLEQQKKPAVGMLQKEKLGSAEQTGAALYGTPLGFRYLDGILKQAVSRRKVAMGMDPMEEQRKQQIHDQQLQFAEDKHQLELQQMQLNMEQAQAVGSVKQEQMQGKYDQEMQAKQQAQQQTQQVQQQAAGPGAAQQATQRRQNLMTSQSPPQ